MSARASLGAVSLRALGGLQVKSVSAYTMGLSSPGSGIPYYQSTLTALFSVAYGNGTYAVGGSNDSIAISSDLYKFSQSNISTGGTVARFYNLAYFPSTGYWVGAESTGIYTSPDGVNWTKVITLDSGRVATVANGIIFVGGQLSSTTYLATSTDGINFTRRNSVATASGVLYSFLYIGSTYVCTDSTGAVFNSADGFTWTQVGSIGTTSITSVTTNGTNIIATKLSSSTVYISSDLGATWSSNTISSTVASFTSCYSPTLNLYCGVCSTTNAVVTSSDGITWSVPTVPFPSTYGFYGCVWDSVESRFIVVGTNRAIMTSSDGVNWTMVVNLSPLNAIGFRDSAPAGQVVWCVVGANGAVGTSTDPNAVEGWTWRVVGANTITYSAVTYGNGLWVIVGAGNNLYTSPDGITWTSRSVTNTNNPTRIVWNGSLFVYGDTSTNGRIHYSANGTTWTNYLISGSTYSTYVQYVNGTWVALSTAAYFTSANPASGSGAWTQRNDSATSGFTKYDVSTNGTTYVTAGVASSNYGLLYMATDINDLVINAAPFTTQAVFNTGIVRSSIWTGSEFVVATSNKYQSATYYYNVAGIKTSPATPNSTTWTDHPIKNTYSEDNMQCIYGNGIIVGVLGGTSGGIYTFSSLTG